MAVERRRWVSESRAKLVRSLPDYDAVSWRAQGGDAGRDLEDGEADEVCVRRRS